MKSIILIGYMGAGKTTVGKNLAKCMGRTFYDLDWYIEHRYHKRIPDIFVEYGEEGFREIERRMLHEAAEFEDVVLACGGGTPCFFDNMDYMNVTGTTVFLEASPATIVAHLKLSRTPRPLLTGKTGEELHSFILAQLAQRNPFYHKAQYTFNVDILDSFDKIDDLVNRITEVLSAQDNGKMEN
jgi:shikimate kinase